MTDSLVFMMRVEGQMYTYIAGDDVSQIRAFIASAFPTRDAFYTYGAHVLLFDLFNYVAESGEALPTAPSREPDETPRVQANVPADGRAIDSDPPVKAPGEDAPELVQDGLAAPPGASNPSTLTTPLTGNAETGMPAKAITVPVADEGAVSGRELYQSNREGGDIMPVVYHPAAVPTVPIMSEYHGTAASIPQIDHAPAPPEIVEDKIPEGPLAIHGALEHAKTAHSSASTAPPRSPSPALPTGEVPILMPSPPTALGNFPAVVPGGVPTPPAAIEPVEVGGRESTSGIMPGSPAAALLPDITHPSPKTRMPTPPTASANLPLVVPHGIPTPPSTVYPMDARRRSSLGLSGSPTPAVPTGASSNDTPASLDGLVAALRPPKPAEMDDSDEDDELIVTTIVPDEAIIETDPDSIPAEGTHRIKDDRTLLPSDRSHLQSLQEAHLSDVNVDVEAGSLSNVDGDDDDNDNANHEDEFELMVETVAPPALPLSQTPTTAGSDHPHLPPATSAPAARPRRRSREDRESEDGDAGEDEDDLARPKKRSSREGSEERMAEKRERGSRRRRESGGSSEGTSGDRVGWLPQK